MTWCLPINAKGTDRLQLIRASRIFLFIVCGFLIHLKKDTVPKGAQHLMRVPVPVISHSKACHEHIPKYMQFSLTDDSADAGTGCSTTRGP